jgi:hypothetical protein
VLLQARDLHALSSLILHSIRTHSGASWSLKPHSFIRKVCCASWWATSLLSLLACLNMNSGISYATALIPVIVSFHCDLFAFLDSTPFTSSWQSISITVDCLIRSSTRRIPCKQASASASSGDPHCHRFFHAVSRMRPVWSRTTIPALAAPVSLQNPASVFSFTHPALGGFHTSFCHLICACALPARSSLEGLSIGAFPFTSISLLPFMHNLHRVAWQLTRKLTEPVIVSLPVPKMASFRRNHALHMISLLRRSSCQSGPES